MKEKGMKLLCRGFLLLGLFVLWTFLVLTVDVQIAGETQTRLGFATLNCKFHELTGIHMVIYHITDWLGLVPVFVCMVFGGIGFGQLIRRKSFLQVDLDLIALGIYYVIVILGYLIFEMIPINYRPILIEGIKEASYPSSTTLLVLGVMPTLGFQVKRRVKNECLKKTLSCFVYSFSVFMVAGRLISGVHWLTDIVGSVLLSAGLFWLYKGTTVLLDRGGEIKNHGIS